MTDEKRPYRKQRRAELEEATRRRITESAVALHGTLGPSQTSLSAIAAHAGRPPVNALPPLRRRGGRVRGMHRALDGGQPGPGSRPLGHDHRPGRASSGSAQRALPLLPAHRADADQPLPRRTDHAGRRPTLRRIPRLSRRRPRRPDERTQTTRQPHAGKSPPRRVTRSRSRRGNRSPATRDSTTRTPPS